MRIMQLRIFLLACAPLLFAGCLDVFFDPVDSPPPIDPPASEARVRFDRDVYPILSVNCAGCHSEAEGSVLGFVGVDPTRAYERILGFPALLGGFLPTAPIATVPAGGHMGVLYTAAERAAIAAWLDAELAERGGTPPPPVPTIESIIQTWSGCLDFSDFTAAGMAPAWSALTTSNGTCTNCHAGGGFGVLITPDAQEFFRLMTTRRIHLLGFFTLDLANGPAGAKVIPHDSRFVRVGSQLPPHSQHPAFNYTGSPARSALLQLHTATAARRDLAGCGPPRLLD